MYYKSLYRGLFRAGTVLDKLRKKSYYVNNEFFCLIFPNMRKEGIFLSDAVISAENAGVHTGFVRLSNEKIRSLCNASSVSGISSLKELGLYGMLSAILSNPSFAFAYGGLQKLRLRHCKNKYYSLHKSWNQLSSLGLLKRIRIPTGTNCFCDYYDLLSVPDVGTPAVRHLSEKEGRFYRDSRRPFLPPEQDFTMLSYVMLMDDRISLAAKGLYAVLARKIRIAGVCGGETVSKEAVFRCCKEGKNAFDAIWRELRSCGYLVLTRCWDSVRKKVFFRYTLNPAPSSAEISGSARSVEDAACRRGIRQTKQDKPLPLHTVSEEASVPCPAADDQNPASEQDIRDQIEYDCLIEEYPRGRVDLLVSILSERLLRTGRTEPPWVRIGGDRVLTSELNRRLCSLHSEEIRFVLDAYDDAVKRTKILHPRQYLLSCLYHAEENLTAALETFAGTIGL